MRGRDGIEVVARSTWVYTVFDGRMAAFCLYPDLGEAVQQLAVRMAV
jgi:hypothetical protein